MDHTTNENVSPFAAKLIQNSTHEVNNYSVV